MARYIIPGFRKIETSGGGGEGGTTNYNDLTNKPFINNVPLVGNLTTVNLKLTDATLTEEGVPAEAKTVGIKLNELNSKYAKKDLYDDTTINVGRKAGTEIGSNSTSEGSETIAVGYCSHAEGEGTNAGDDYAHVEGLNTYANYCSHAEGEGSTADSAHQHVEGKYNISDLSHQYAHIIGNGNSDGERSNAHTVDWEGNAWYAGDVFNGNGVSLDGLNTNMSDVWNNSVTYGVNSYCIYNNKLWKCKVQHTNQPPTEGTYWTTCTISGEISELNSNLGSLNLQILTKTTGTNSIDLKIPAKNNSLRRYINVLMISQHGYIVEVNVSIHQSDYVVGYKTRYDGNYQVESISQSDNVLTITLNADNFWGVAFVRAFNVSGLS